MELDWWTFGLQAVNFLVLVWLLQYFLFRPVSNVIARRREEAQKMLSEAEAARKEAEAELARARAEAERQLAGRGRLLEEAEREAKARQHELIAAARKEAEGIIAEARAEARRLHEQEVECIEDRAAELAVEIAARLLARLPDEARVAAFIPGLAEQLRRLPEEVRHGIAEGGARFQLHTPRALAEAEIAAVRKAVSEAFGQQVEITAEVDPAIIAGLELTGPFGAVRNSFRADLARVKEVLAGHDRHPA